MPVWLQWVASSLPVTHACQAVHHLIFRSSITASITAKYTSLTDQPYSLTNFVDHYFFQLDGPWQWLCWQRFSHWINYTVVDMNWWNSNHCSQNMNIHFKYLRSWREIYWFSLFTRASNYCVQYFSPFSDSLIKSTPPLTTHSLPRCQELFINQVTTFLATLTPFD